MQQEHEGHIFQLRVSEFLGPVSDVSSLSLLGDWEQFAGAVLCLTGELMKVKCRVCFSISATKCRRARATDIVVLRSQTYQLYSQCVLDDIQGGE